jgi:hypothetical protein
VVCDSGISPRPKIPCRKTSDQNIAIVGRDIGLVARLDRDALSAELKSAIGEDRLALFSAPTSADAITRRSSNRCASQPPCSCRLRSRATGLAPHWPLYATSRAMTYRTAATFGSAAKGSSSIDGWCRNCRHQVGCPPRSLLAIGPKRRCLIRVLGWSAPNAPTARLNSRDSDCTGRGRLAELLGVLLPRY